MTTNSRRVFLDTNILVRADTLEAPLHSEAAATIQRLRNEGAELWINRQVLREYLATLTRPQTFATPPPIAAVVARVRTHEAQFRVAEDGPQVMEKLLTLMEQTAIGGKQVHDANIVATMQAYSIDQLLTHNVEDFARFSSLITIAPLVAAGS